MTFIHGYCEILNMKFNIWLETLCKYLGDPYVIVSFPVGIFSKGLTDTFCQDFSF